MLKTAQEIFFPYIFGKTINNTYTWLLIWGNKKKKRDNITQEI